MIRNSLTIYALLAYVLIYLPIGLVVLMSFTAATISQFPVENLTFHWYRELFGDERTLDALWNSVLVAAPATLGATVLGLFAAMAIVRYRFWGKRGFIALATMPMLAPGIILGISILLFFRTVGLSTGYLAVLAGHMLLGLPYATFIIVASLARFDVTLEDAARGLGANELSVFFRVTLPGIRAGLLGAALFAFTISIGEFIVTFFLVSAGSATLPIRIYSVVKVGITPAINAVSSLILFATVVIAMAGFLVTWRRSS